MGLFAIIIICSQYKDPKIAACLSLRSFEMTKK